MKKGIVYLIHFKSKLHHAQHYVGFCEEGNLESRMDQHMSGSGSKLMRAVTEAGIEWHVVKIWEGDRRFERKLKKRHNTKFICPACKKKAA